MIASLLIANRGEIARRIMRTARRLKVRTIAVYSDADGEAPHVREADTAIRVGPAPARESYLRVDAILDAAATSGAEAIHPGYGFLSENADFAEQVEAAGLVWVGAPAAAIRAMGLKDAAKRLMAAAGVPVTPGYLGDDQSPDTLAAEAARIGWPVLIKAVAGGGGKGMRAVHAAEGFADALDGARREAAAAFGDDRVLLEKLIASPRHIEVQVFADAHGGVVHLFERDCSLQRRHQKVVEEAPAPGMDAATRAHVTAAAIQAARSVAYRGAGTVEFIADATDGLRPDRLWFMEMNTRLQVEHPVTEAITGLDLVEWQLRVACGEPLPLAQAQIQMRGHAMEARLYAEDPSRGFLPSPGRLEHLRLPDFVRVDSGVAEGDVITPFYDPMIAKLIAHGPDRAAAAEALEKAAQAVAVWPVRTNAAFLARCLAEPDFRAGRIDTGFIEVRLAALTDWTTAAPAPDAVGALDPPSAGGSAWSPSTGATGFRLNDGARTTTSVRVDGAPMQAPFAFGAAEVVRLGDGDLIAFSAGAAIRLSRGGAGGDDAAGAVFDGAVRTPMPGRIARVSVAVGDEVRAGQALVVLEAMKMEHVLTSPVDGRVLEVAAREGDQVVDGLAVVRLEAGRTAAPA